jgi:hypothetical protein
MVAVHVVVPFFLHTAPGEQTYALDGPSTASLAGSVPKSASAAAMAAVDDQNTAGQSDFLFFDVCLQLPVHFNPATDLLERTAVQSVVACSGRFHALTRLTYDTHPWALDWDLMLAFADQKRGRDMYYHKLIDNFAPVKPKKSKKKGDDAARDMPAGLPADAVEAHFEQALHRLNTLSVRAGALFCSKWHLFQSLLKEQPAAAPAAQALTATGAVHDRALPFYSSTSGSINSGAVGDAAFGGLGGSSSSNDTRVLWAMASRMLNDTFRDSNKTERLKMMAVERARARAFTAKIRTGSKLG